MSDAKPETKENTPALPKSSDQVEQQPPNVAASINLSQEAATSIDSSKAQREGQKTLDGTNLMPL